MVFLLILLIELILLYFISRLLNQSLFALFYRLSRSQHIGIMMTTLIFFPGTVVHELSHLFTAEILGVRTGKLSLVPQKLGDGHFQAGSVMVEKTDPFRRTIIGLSPIFVGILCITLLSMQITKFFPTMYQELTYRNPQLTTVLFFLFGYLLFAVSNSMFSSKEDLEGVVPVLVVVGIFLITLYVVGLRIQLTGGILDTISSIIKMVVTNTGIVLGINLILLIGIQGLLYLIRPRH